MTQSPLPRIDWRQQLGGLEPYLSERGGVVHVQASEGSPTSTFSKAIRQLMASEQWNRPWRCVQLDARNPSTHYLDDVVAQLDRSLEFDQVGSNGDDAAVQVATNIQAQTVTVSNVDISYQEDDYLRHRRSLARLDRVVHAIEERLQAERIALLFLDSHTYDQKTLSRFRGMLWDDRLEAMTSLGLLLIDISDPTSGCGPDWPPPPDLLVELPERFDNASRLEAHADLASLALEEGLVANPGEADVFAEVLLNSSNTIRDVYAHLATARARMQESA